MLKAASWSLNEKLFPTNWILKAFSKKTFKNEKFVQQLKFPTRQIIPLWYSFVFICLQFSVFFSSQLNRVEIHQQTERKVKAAKKFLFESINNFPSLAFFNIFFIFSIVERFSRKNSTEIFPFQRSSRARNSMFLDALPKLN